MRSPFAGVYARFADVPRLGQAFDDGGWVNTAVAYAKSFRERSASRFIPPDVVDEKALLPLLVAILAERGCVRIVDFGGAAGFSYLAMKAALSPDVAVDYLVVEHRSVCDAGRELFAGEGDIRFAPELPEPGEEIEIVLLGASLQYVEDYHLFLERLAKLRARYILFTKMPAGDIPTFATAQVNLPGKQHAHWLFNVREIAGLMDSAGYRLAFKSAVAGEVNQRTFASDHRLGQFCNLLFRRERE